MWSFPLAINRYDGPFISSRDLGDSGSEEKFICSFDENSDVFRNLSLLQVPLWAETTYSGYGRQFALLLKPAASEGEERHFKHVGASELSYKYDMCDFNMDYWEGRTVTIV